MGLLARLFGWRRPSAADGGVCRDIRPLASVAEVKPELLIVGLGNPGGKYAGTRHNVGFDVIDELRVRPEVEILSSGRCCEADCWVVKCGGKPALFVKPLTYMNLSGDAVGALINRYKLTPADCLVIVDDFNIPLGKIRIRKSGSPGGHNGLKSISAEIGDDYPRVRVGIGPLPAGVSVIDFVLGRFSDSEREGAAKAIGVAAEAVVLAVADGVDIAMNRYN